MASDKKGLKRFFLNQEETGSRYLNIAYYEVSNEERLTTGEGLLAYCGLDTEGMIRIAKQLDEITRYLERAVSI